MFERTEIVESIYEGVVTPFYEKILGKNLTALDSVGKREERPPLQTLTSQRMRALASAVNDM